MKTRKNTKERFQQFILRFYRLHGRHELPWRKTTDAYHILVSELMLQQTQVDRVIPKYLAFLQQFPTLEKLAAAPLNQVLILWQGLGYNRRAKFIWQTAQRICNGQVKASLPKTKEELEQLPGIGPYTAAAILAFAYDQKNIVIETNIRAVFLYHFFPEKEKVSDLELAKCMAEIEPTQGAREWYWALMDYGAVLKKLLPNPSRKSRHHLKQSKFQGSLRQTRGEIIRLLSKNKQLSLTDLESKIETNMHHFSEALRQVVAENLVVQDGQLISLAE